MNKKEFIGATIVGIKEGSILLDNGNSIDYHECETYFNVCNKGEYVVHIKWDDNYFKTEEHLVKDSWDFRERKCFTIDFKENMIYFEDWDLGNQKLKFNHIYKFEHEGVMGLYGYLNIIKKGE